MSLNRLRIRIDSCRPSLGRNRSRLLRDLLLEVPNITILLILFLLLLFRMDYISIGMLELPPTKEVLTTKLMKHLTKQLLIPYIESIPPQPSTIAPNNTNTLQELLLSHTNILLEILPTERGDRPGLLLRDRTLLLCTLAVERLH